MAPFDFVELNGMYACARVLHRYASGEPAPLPVTGPAIVIANHPSHADPLFLAASCPRPLHFLQAREQYDIWPLRYIFHRAGCIPVARNGRDVAAVWMALEQLRQGAVVCIFPE